MVKFDKDGFIIRQKINKNIKLNEIDNFSNPTLEKQKENKPNKLIKQKRDEKNGKKE